MEKLKFCPRCGENLSDKITDGRERKFCEKCERPVYENPVPATAGVIINNKREILLVRRGVEPAKGKWCLPGGFMEVDETTEECCIRELKEETGLEGEIDSLVGAVRSESPFYKSVIVMGFFIKNVNGIPIPGDDSEETRYFCLDNMPEIAFKSHIKIINRVVKEERFDINKDQLAKTGAYVITSGDHIKVAGEACRAGAGLIQYRDKESVFEDKLKTAKKIREITLNCSTLFIVNDYIDIALISGADGVHLGQDDLSVGEARKIVPKNFIVGKSTHSMEQALKAEADGADYIGIGPVFRTPTKKDYIPVGVDLAKEVVKKIKIPVVAIGGLNIENLGQLQGTGLTNFAMVREFQQNTAKNVKLVNSKIFRKKKSFG